MVLGAPLEDAELAQLRRKYPDFTGEMPAEAKWWTESDLDLFFGSNGKLKPRETAKAARQTCPFLSRCRLRLAEQQIDAATPDYLSWCRLLQSQRVVKTLPGFAECTEVPRVDEAPAGLRRPVVLSKSRIREVDGSKVRRSKCRDWNMEFWRWQCGQQVWHCRAQTPVFEQDSDEGAESVMVESSVSEYVDYVRILQRMDPSCEEDSALAYPRFALDGWPTFAISETSLIEDNWKNLTPPGVKDLTLKWVKLFASVFNVDWMELFCRFYKVSIGATGTMGRLRSENNKSHIWFTQAEGKKAFFLFSPQEAAKLYPQTGEVMDAPEGHTETASPVDIFAPSAKRHPRAAEAKAQIAILGPGETLVVPAGWWHSWVTLEPSVTISHEFWNMENKAFVVEAFKGSFVAKSMPADVRAEANQSFERLRSMIHDDDDSDMED